MLCFQRHSNNEDRSLKECVATVTHNVGLHARPAAQFMKLAKGFDARITIVNMTRDSGRVANAKSLIELIKIACAKGHTVRIIAEGSDEVQAINTLLNFVKSGE